jgi:zinc transporter ZupT
LDETLRNTASFYLNQSRSKILQQQASFTVVSLVALSSDTDTSKDVRVLQVELCTMCRDPLSEAAKFTLRLRFPLVGTWFIFSDQELKLTAQDSSAARVLSSSPTENLRRSSDESSCECNCDSDKHMWIGIILGVGFFGMIPVLFKQFAESDTVMTFMSLFNCFGGGALFTVAISHIFPEALELYPKEKSGDYPAAAMLVPAGYFALLMFDKVLISLCMEHDTPSSPPQPEEDTSNPIDSDSRLNVLVEISGKIGAGTVSAPGSGQGHGIGGDAPAGHIQSKSVVLAIGVFVAMSIHSLLAGFALGLACNSSDVEALGIAITCHKLFDVSSLGIVLVRQNTALSKAFPLVLIVAVMTPIGAWVGMAGDEVNDKVNGALQAVAAGTFIYVGVQEVLANEFHDKRNVLLKALSCVLGMGMIALVALAKEPEE